LEANGTTTEERKHHKGFFMRFSACIFHHADRPQLHTKFVCRLRALMYRYCRFPVHHCVDS
jgi:hypothetical protein